MKIEIENITYNFHYEGSDYLLDNENLGLGHLLIPGPMCNRFARECGWKDEGRLVIPHYDREDMVDNNVLKESEHNCHNTDTQIVLMHWLMDKKRKYKLDFYGLDPFWLYHDSFHAQNDVYGMEVNNIYSHVEHCRLFEGAEFAYSKGILIKPETVAKLNAEWSGRWKFREGTGFTPLNYTDFFPFMEEEDIELLDMMVEHGTFTNN